MTKTKYYDLQMDDPQDDYDVEVVNANLKKIDEQMKTRENATDALQEPEFTVAAKRENIASKEKMPKILGKIAKFFADLKTVAFSGKYNDLDGKPAIVNNNTTTEPGSALDARQANPNIEGTMAANIQQINSNLNKKIDKIRYDNSDKGVEISYLGAAFIVLYQGGSLGAAIYFVNSTSYVFSYTKISDTLANWKVTFSSVDKTTGTFNIAWNTASYVTYLIPLI